MQCCTVEASPSPEPSGGGLCCRGEGCCWGPCRTPALCCGAGWPGPWEPGGGCCAWERPWSVRTGAEGAGRPCRCCMYRCTWLRGIPTGSSSSSSRAWGGWADSSAGGDRARDRRVGGDRARDIRMGGDRARDNKLGGDRALDNRVGGERARDSNEGGDRARDSSVGGESGRDSRVWGRGWGGGTGAVRCC